MAQEITAFFSYSRTDSEFVDRLDADLRARGFRTWIDRHKLEGGQEWPDEIKRAIARHEFFFVVLSRAAVESKPVQDEIQIALQLEREGIKEKGRIIPIMHEDCALPSALSGRHFIFEFLRQSYDVGLKELLYVCQNPSVGMMPSSTNLYAEALAVRATDPERAAVLLQHIADHDSQETVRQEARRDLEQLNRQLYAQRAQRLEQQAKTARAAGAYGEEAGALEALIALGDQDPALLAWAKEYLPVAQQNSKQLGLYEIAQERLRADDPTTAREKLRAVWAGAPFFRDPAGIAPDLGLEQEMPITYEEDKARRPESEKAERLLASIKAEHDRITGMVSGALRAWTSNSDRDDLDTLARELDLKTTRQESHADTLLRQFVSYGQKYREAKKGELETRMERAYPGWLDDNFDDSPWLQGVVGILAVGAGAAILDLIVQNKTPQDNFYLNIILGIVAGIIGGVIIGGAVYAVVILPLFLVFKLINTQLHEALVNQLERETLRWLQEAEVASRQWQSAYAKEFQAQVQQIEKDCDSALAIIGEQFH